MNILPVVLYGCESWSLTLREECRLRVFVNRVLRRIFGPKRDEVRGEWRRLHNKELYALYSSPNIIRVILQCSSSSVGVMESDCSKFVKKKKVVQTSCGTYSVM
jgi:hypothetical protein